MPGLLLDGQINGHTGSQAEHRAGRRVWSMAATRVIAVCVWSPATAGYGRRPWELACGRRHHMRAAAKRQEQRHASGLRVRQPLLDRRTYGRMDGRIIKRLLGWSTPYYQNKTVIKDLTIH